MFGRIYRSIQTKPSSLAKRHSSQNPPKKPPTKSKKWDLGPAEEEIIHGDVAIRRSNIYGPTVEQTWSGVLSFMRRNYSRNLEGVDVAVSGVPLDTATTHRPGARLGPRGIRQASTGVAELKPYGWGGFDPFSELAVIDYGDCWLDPYNPLTIKNAIIEHARTILSKKVRMLTLGGDHYISYPLLIAHAEAFGAPLSLVHFDAHCDTWPDEGPDQMNHGTMFCKAVKEGIVDPSKSVQIGIRTHNDDFMGFNIIDAPTVHQIGEMETVKRILEIVGDKPVYLTFDIDALDPAFAPGTGTPVSGGLTTSQALQIIRNLQGLNIVGMDIVEVAPPFDHSEVTALAAAHIGLDLLCLWAKQKGKNGGTLRW